MTASPAYMKQKIGVLMLITRLFLDSAGRNQDGAPDVGTTATEIGFRYLASPT